MSTITPAQVPMTLAGQSSSLPLVPVPGDQRIVFRDVDWHTYHSLSEATGEGQHIRLAYDGKDLEIITFTRIVHEHLKALINKIVNAVTLGLDIDYLSCGETTWQTKLRGLQADLSYYFDPEKIQVARDALVHKSMNAADDPRPDLAIEIDISGPQIDRPSIYADLGIVEVWRYANGQKLIIEHLQPDGSYAQVESSQFLRIRAVDILGWLTAEDSGREAAWNRRLNQWAMGLGQQA